MATIVNPKALTVYLVVVPGVAVSLGQSLRTVGVVFAVTHIICTFGWLATVDCLIQRARWLGSPDRVACSSSPPQRDWSSPARSSS